MLFLQLELQEYGIDCEEEYSGYTDEENECQESLPEKIGHAFRDRPIEGLALEEAEDIESPQAAGQCLWRKVAGNQKYGTVKQLSLHIQILTTTLLKLLLPEEGGRRTI